MDRLQRGDEPQHQEQTSNPLPKCPRCDSVDTKFRYYNNHSLAQPRYYCRTCKRQWTEGGNLRDVPIGGKSRNKQTSRATSSCGTSRAHHLPPTFSTEEGSHYLVPQIFTNIQPFANVPTTIYPYNLNQPNDEISSLDAIEYLIQTEVTSQPLSAGIQFYPSANVGLLQEYHATPQQTFPEQIPINLESYQLHNQVISNDRMAQPTRPMDSLPHQDMLNNSNPSASVNACWWNNSGGSTTDPNLVATSMNPNQRPNFPSYGPP